MAPLDTAKPEANSDAINPRARAVLIGAWLLSFTVSLVAFLAWGLNNRWQVLPLNIYQFFPLLGLLAWSLMWSHYVSAYLRDVFKVNAQALARYFQFTGYAVLVLICLHPGLLIYKRFKDGFGLPPHSYESYVAPGLGWVTLLGTVSLLVFLAYELRRWYGNRPWWKYVVSAGDLAMLTIFYHSLRLGTQLRMGGWFRTIWWFYGVVLILVLGRKYFLKLKKAR